MKSLTPLIPVIVFIAMATLAIAIRVYRSRKEKERTQQLQPVASQLGWTFAATSPFNMIPGLERFALFNQGHSKEIKNFMYGTASNVKAAVFDYVYVTGSGRNRTTHYQSVVYFEPGNLRLPYFTLRPENFLYKILATFGYQDIDFGQRPEFSRQYILRGQDEPAIRQTFNDRLLAFYESYPQTCTDAGGNQLFFFRSSYRFQPQEIQSYVAFGLNLLSLFPQY